MNIGDTLKVLSDPIRREILQLLKSTIAKIENYQNIVCNQVNL